jgi:hypothetical protein
MRRSLLLASSLALLMGAVALAQGRVEGTRPDCVEVEAIARSTGYAYNHWVTLTNGCSEATRCTVATDVAPSSTEVMLRPEEHRELLTYRGSPASAFTATVNCRFSSGTRR